ncbi:MAG: hypothetical protein ACREGK_07535, partial [Geminicoccales bacterium]
MTDLASTELIERAAVLDESHRSAVRTAPSRGAGATVSIQPSEFRAELACGCPQAGAEREPYEEGFGAYASGAGLLDNPYHGDNCAH